MTPHPAAEEVWKPCDLRGTFPDCVSPALFRDVGSAIGTMLPREARVVVSGDYRLSTNELKAALTDGLAQTGMTILDAGQGPTPLAYFAANHLHADAVLIVTASHNPPAHNGLKLMLGSVPTTPEQLQEIRKLTRMRGFRWGAGAVEKVDQRSLYMKSMLKRWRGLQGNGRRRVVIDAGNGAWSELAPVIFTDLGFEAVCLSCTVDGRFPDRSPDCARAGNLLRLSAAVRERPGAIGIAWDGDGDRAAFIDEDGSYVPPDEIAILIARSALSAIETESNTNRKVVVDVKFSDAVRHAVVEAGGDPILERTGHAFMRGRMVKEDALLGLDACGHYFFRELHGGDDGLFSSLFLLDLVQRSGRQLCALRRELPKTFTTPELRIPTLLVSFDLAKNALRTAFPEANTSEIDGLRLTIPEGLVLVRESGTEAVVSLRFEGFHKEGFDRIQERILSALPSTAEWLRQELELSAAV
jgi:phosphomannomutase / phosphoglucomutase